MAKVIILLVFLLPYALSVPFTKIGGEPEIIFNNAGVHRTFKEDRPQLSGLTQVSEICKTGVWIAYTGEDYSYGSGFGVIEIFPVVQTSCHTPYSSQQRSTRLAGLYDTYTAPSATFYEQPTLQGDGISTNTDIPELDISIGSLVTINTQVQFFKEANFTGDSVCYENDPVFCQETVCWTFDLGGGSWDISQAKSVTVGCDKGGNVFRQRVAHRGKPTVARNY